MTKWLHHTIDSNEYFKTQINPSDIGIYEFSVGGITPGEAFLGCWIAFLVVKMMERVRMEFDGRMPDCEPLFYNKWEVFVFFSLALSFSRNATPVQNKAG